MQIDSKFHIEKVASTDDGREILHGVYIDCRKPEAHVAIATNGRALAVVPIDDVQDGEAGKLIPSAVMPKARKLAGKYGRLCLGLNGAIKLSDGSTMPFADNEGKEFPNWRQIVPEEGRPGAIKVALNPALLSAIASAIGATGEIVTLEIAPYQRNKDSAPDWSSNAIRITYGRSPGAFGVMMPGRVN